MKPWLYPVSAQMAANAAVIGGQVPVLRADGVTLRAPILSDFAVWSKIACSDRSEYFGGPFSEEEAWDDFCRMTAVWMLRGHGAWAVQSADGLVLGFVLIGFEPGDEEPELGFVFLPEAEGKGLAFAAAMAARDHAFGPMGLTTLVSYIDPQNSRALALAERLGALRDGMTDGAEVWRYLKRRTA